MNKYAILLVMSGAFLWGCRGDSGSEGEAGETVGDGDTGDGDGDTGDGDGDTGDGDGDTGDGDGDGDGDADSPCANVSDIVEQKDNGQTHAGYGVDVGADGSIAVVGVLENANNDAWIGLYDAEGTKLWEQVVDSGYGNDSAVNVTFDQDGDLVFVGRLAGADGDGELWIEKRSAGDGTVDWTVVEPSDFDGDNEPGDVELAPDGSIVVSGSVRPQDKDTDIWVRKLSSADGAETWTSTYSGNPDANGYSIDYGGPLGIAADGTIYVGGEEGVDFETREAVVIQYAADGSEQWAVKPKGGGGAHLHEVLALTAGPDGEAYLTIYQSGAAAGFWLMQMSSAGDPGWELTEEDFIYGATDKFTVADLDIADDGTLTVGGRLTNEEVGQAISWGEAWIANISLEGVGQCLASHTWQNTHIIPASTYGYGFAEGPTGAVAVGEVIDGPENRLWIGFYK